MSEQAEAPMLSLAYEPYGDLLVGRVAESESNPVLVPIDDDLILYLETPDVGRLLGFQIAHFVGSESGSERLSDRMYALVLGSPTVGLLRGFYQQALDRHLSVPHLRDVEDADVEEVLVSSRLAADYDASALGIEALECRDWRVRFLEAFAVELELQGSPAEQSADAPTLRLGNMWSRFLGSVPQPLAVAASSRSRSEEFLFSTPNVRAVIQIVNRTLRLTGRSPREFAGSTLRAGATLSAALVGAGFEPLPETRFDRETRRVEISAVAIGENGMFLAELGRVEGSPEAFVDPKSLEIVIDTTS